MENKKWDTITREELYELFCVKNYTDSMIAEEYGVTKSAVTSKRRKMNVTMMGGVIDKAIGDCGEKLDENALSLLKEYDINDISKAIVQYVFRNGPIENMHRNGDYSQEDMKTLNKYMNNKIATILYLIKEEKWYNLYRLFNLYNKGTSEWDEYTLCEDDIKASDPKLPF